MSEKWIMKEGVYMEDIYNMGSQDNIVEEIILNLRTQKCKFIQSKLYKGKSGTDWKKFIDYLMERKFIYYIDVERFLQEVLKIAMKF